MGKFRSTVRTGTQAFMLPMDHFTVLDAACIFLGAIAVLILQTYRQQPAGGSRRQPAAGRGPRFAKLAAGNGLSDAQAAESLRCIGPVVGQLRGTDCYDFVELHDGVRYYFAGAVHMRPDGTPDPRYRPDHALILDAGHLYLPERISGAARHRSGGAGLSHSG